MLMATASKDAWYVHDSGGALYDNGRGHGGLAGDTSDYKIISIGVGLWTKDKGTLRFWVDGKPHGPDWSSGVAGSLRGVVCLYYEGNAAQIMPTAELQLALDTMGSSRARRQR